MFILKVKKKKVNKLGSVPVVLGLKKLTSTFPHPTKGTIFVFYNNLHDNKTDERVYPVNTSGEEIVIWKVYYDYLL